MVLLARNVRDLAENDAMGRVPAVSKAMAVVF